MIRNDMNIEVPTKSEFEQELLDSEIKSVCGLIEQNLASGSAACNQLIKYFRENCGKMIRPRLLLLSAGACGKITKDHILAAAAFQIIHDATLLHDDVIDEGLLRRNKATINSSWGSKIAVLTGDMILSHAMKMCLGLNRQARAVIVDAMLKTCEGEIRQDFNVPYDNITEQEYLSIIRMKSAEMFGQCCYIGGLLSGADKETCRHLKSYGFSIGTAYQISDDIADICGDDNQLGKSSGRDIETRIMTLPMIHLLAQGYDYVTLKTMSRSDVIELLNEKGSFSHCREFIRKYCSQAIDQLTCLPKSEYKSALEEAARLILSKSVVGLPRSP